MTEQPSKQPESLLRHQFTPDDLWNNLHVKHGQSAKAAQLAQQELDQVDTNNFTDPDQIKAHGEYARIAMVTALSAAKKARSWPQAREQLLLSLNTIIDHYPLATDLKLAQKRSRYWEGVYGEQSAQLICLRDLWSLIETFDQLLTDEQLASFSSNLFKLLTDLSQEQTGEIFALIFMTESADYAQAQLAFQCFLDDLEHNEQGDINQAVTVIARFLGRAVDNQDWPQVWQCLKLLRDNLKHNLQLSRFTGQEIVKNLSRLAKDKYLAVKYQHWSEVAREDQLLDKRLHTLIDRAFVGIGRDELVRI